VLEQISSYLPTIAIVGGLLLLAWGQRDWIAEQLGKLWPKAAADPPLAPADRFTTFYALRTWCEEAGHIQAVKALDAQVLPAIVQRGPQP